MIKEKMVVVVCHIDTHEGDLSDVWFIPFVDFIKKSNKFTNKKGEKCYGFVSGRGKKNQLKLWDEYRIDRRDLANEVMEQIKKSYQ